MAAVTMKEGFRAGRDVRRAGQDRVLGAREVLNAVTLVHVTSVPFEDAGRLDPSGLRSLDAIHLAAALTSETTLRG